ncbi:MAG: hypothetical protein P4L61_01445 [Candidatus Pacebacteria bacterium]|nr:hypothetical protein [Candidatus Paceibacterota bacterium]
MALKDPKNFEWKILYAVAISFDILEPLAELTLSEFFAAPEFIEEFADPAIGVCFAIWFQIRGVSMVQRPGRLLAMVAADLAEQLSINVAPGWWGDIWYMHKSVQEEWAAEQEGKEYTSENLPLNKSVGGKMMRLPPSAKPLNQGNTRPPLNLANNDAQRGAHTNSPQRTQNRNNSASTGPAINYTDLRHVQNDEDLGLSA